MKKILFTLLLSTNHFAFAQSTEVISLATVITGKQRPSEHKERDQYRHPQQTLEFFELKNNMTVVQISAEQDWYAEILAPYLKDEGKLYSVLDGVNLKDQYDWLKKIQHQPHGYGKLELSVLPNDNSVTLAPNNSADRVLAFHSVHHWMHNDQAASVFNAMYNALKPGGILGVVEHRNSALKPQDSHATSGYVSEDYLIELARKAGFEFLAKSEINANSKDSKDYPAGVWTLPPTLKLKDQDRQKYLAIGESDCMTIKFVKPAKTALLDIIRSAVAF